MKFVYVWLTISFLCALLEIGHPGLFYFLSFACGALGASIVTYFEFSFFWQCSTFLLVVSLSLLLLRTLVSRIAAKRESRTNVYALRGKHGLVFEQIEPFKPGLVKLNGELWRAVTQHKEIIRKGTEIIVIEVKGVHVIVELFQLSKGIT